MNFLVAHIVKIVVRFGLIDIRTEKMKIEVIIEMINEYEENHQLFWVCGLAKECYPILKNHLDDLHLSARMAVEHYAETNGK